MSFFITLIKFCTLSKIFRYLQTRYTVDLICELNNILKLQGKIQTAHSNRFYFFNCVWRIEYVRRMLVFIFTRTKPNIFEHAFIHEEIAKLSISIDKLKREVQSCWMFCCGFASYFDNIHFGHHFAIIDGHGSITLQINYQMKLISKYFVNSSISSNKVVLKLTKYQSSTT